MTVLVDSQGVELPAIESPSPEKLRVYGDMMFLAFRSPRHGAMNVRALRAWLEPAVETGQFRIFRFDDVPRGMYTWAWLTREAERKLIEGAPLAPEDWTNGDRLWIVDLIVPYRGLMPQLGRWLMVKGNFAETEFLFRRVSGRNNTRRIVQADVVKPSRTRVWTEADFLKSLG